MDNPQVSLIYRLHRLPMVIVFVLCAPLQWPLSLYGFLSGFFHSVALVCLCRMVYIFHIRYVASIYVVLSVCLVVSIFINPINNYQNFVNFSWFVMYILATEIAACVMKYIKVSDNCMRKIDTTQPVEEVPQVTVEVTSPNVESIPLVPVEEQRHVQHDVQAVQVRTALPPFSNSQSNSQDPPPYSSVSSVFIQSR